MGRCCLLFTTLHSNRICNTLLFRMKSNGKPDCLHWSYDNRWLQCCSLFSLFLMFCFLVLLFFIILVQCARCSRSLRTLWSYYFFFSFFLLSAIFFFVLLYYFFCFSLVRFCIYFVFNSVVTSLNVFCHLLCLFVFGFVLLLSVQAGEVFYTFWRKGHF